MARIQDDMLNSAVYLYKSEEAARNGDNAGGSGFLVEMPSQRHKGLLHVYAVSNAHVVRQRFSVVRLVTSKGETMILPFSIHDWHQHREGDDLSVCPIPLKAREPVSAVPAKWFISGEIISSEDIGPGDEIVMVGRFVTHGGKQRNTPTARFGHISMMPHEPITNSVTGLTQQSFLVECHAISGFSGSPVFVQILPLSVRPAGFDSERDRAQFAVRSNFSMWLLGIEWGHIPIYAKVVDKKNEPHPEGWRVPLNSAIMGVVPAWKLKELLDEPELMEQREKEDERFAKELSKADHDAVLDVAEEESQPFTQADFEAALKKVARKIEAEKKK